MKNYRVASVLSKEMVDNASIDLVKREKRRMISEIVEQFIEKDTEMLDIRFNFYVLLREDNRITSPMMGQHYELICESEIYGKL